MKLIATLFLVLNCILGLAQDTISVYEPVSFYGKPFYFNSETKSWDVINKDTKIELDGKVRLNPSSYLLLVSKDQVLEFNLKGTYSLAEYKGKAITLNNKAKEFLNQGLDSLMVQTSKRNGLYNQNLLDVKTDEDLISLFPSPTLTYDKEIELQWRPMDDNVYIVKMYHTENSIYFYREVKGDRIKINMSQLHIPSDRCIYWTVSVKGSNYTSTPKCIYILSIGESSTIELERYDIENQLNLKSSAIHNLLFALFYESHGIMHKAEEYYRLAWDLSKHSTRYKQIYYNFLNRRNNHQVE